MKSTICLIRLITRDKYNKKQIILRDFDFETKIYEHISIIFFYFNSNYEKTIKIARF